MRMPVLCAVAAVLQSFLPSARQGRSEGGRSEGGRGARDRGARDRGDVPGWVLITLMTAGLVVGLWAVAGPRLEALFTQAMDTVVGQL